MEPPTLGGQESVVLREVRGQSLSSGSHHSGWSRDVPPHRATRPRPLSPPPTHLLRSSSRLLHPPPLSMAAACRVPRRQSLTPCSCCRPIPLLLQEILKQEELRHAKENTPFQPVHSLEIRDLENPRSAPTPSDLTSCFMDFRRDGDAILRLDELVCSLKGVGSGKPTERRKLLARKA